MATEPHAAPADLCPGCGEPKSRHLYASPTSCVIGDPDPAPTAAYVSCLRARLRFVMNERAAASRTRDERRRSRANYLAGWLVRKIEAETNG